jgi:hypothetical protein
MAIKGKKSSVLTKNGKVKLGALSKEKLTTMLETAKPKIKDKIINRLKLI